MKFISICQRFYYNLNFLYFLYLLCLVDKVEKLRKYINIGNIFNVLNMMVYVCNLSILGLNQDDWLYVIMDYIVKYYFLKKE